MVRVLLVIFHVLLVFQVFVIALMAFIRMMTKRNVFHVKEVAKFAQLMNALILPPIQEFLLLVILLFTACLAVRVAQQILWVVMLENAPQ